MCYVVYPIILYDTRNTLKVRVLFSYFLRIALFKKNPKNKRDAEKELQTENKRKSEKKSI